MTLIGHAHSSQFMEWQNLGIKALKYAKYTPNVFKKLPENWIATDFTSQLHKLLRPSQFLEKFMEILKLYTFQK